jgi:hypothetical protein
MPFIEILIESTCRVAQLRQATPSPALQWKNDFSEVCSDSWGQLTDLWSRKAMGQ